MYVTTTHGASALGSWLGEQAAPQINWCQRRNDIAATARAEEARWTAANGTKILENDPSRIPILRSYWAAVPGVNPVVAAAGSAADLDEWTWSAAFICFVMQRAGVLPGQGFEFGRRHMTFIVGALRNRERSDRNRPFWLLDAVEIERESQPQPGDILCFNRCVSGRPADRCDDRPGFRLTTHQYSTLRNSFWGANQHVMPTGNSHTAIVVGTVEVNGRRFAETVGGNERNSVRLRRVPLNQHGGIENPAAQNIFGMIKIVTC